MRPNERNLSIIGRTTVAGLALLAVVACAKKEGTQTDTMASTGAIAPPPQPAALQVADVTLGKKIGADKRITDQAETFSTRDTIFASVHTTGTAQGASIVARWMFQDGQVVDERTETVSPTGDAYTEFHIAKPSGWPEGKYTLHILVNGQEVQSRQFTVQK